MQRRGDQGPPRGPTWSTARRPETALVQLAAEHGLDVKALRRSHPLVRTEYRAEQALHGDDASGGRARQAVHAVKGSPTECYRSVDLAWNAAPLGR